MGMLDAPVDLDLTHELLLGATLRQAALLNDFGCVHELGLGIDEFEALRETTFAKELAFQVAPDADFAVLLLELFLDDDLGRGGGRSCVLVLLTG